MATIRIYKVAEVLGRKVETVYKALSRIHSTLGECVRRRIREEAPNG